MFSPGRAAVAVVVVASLGLSACGGSSETSAPTSTEVLAEETTTSSVPESTTIPKAPMFSRDTLIALEKCSSDAVTAGIWVVGGFREELESRRDVCEEARDQIAVDQTLGVDSDEIKAYKVELSAWILALQEEIVNLTIGREGDSAKITEAGLALSSATNELLSLMGS